jgi:hypothetical protein
MVQAIHTSSSCRISAVGVVNICSQQSHVKNFTNLGLCHLSDGKLPALSDDWHQTWRYDRGITEYKQKEKSGT